MSKRTISINPQFFNISKKKKKIIPSEVNINASNIRQLLLDKLKEHKKTRKIETEKKIVPLLQDKTFDESCKDVDKTEIRAEISDRDTKSERADKVEKMDKSEKVEKVESKMDKPIEKDGDKPYGNLKNGTKPTYKQIYNEVNHIHPEDTETSQLSISQLSSSQLGMSDGTDVEQSQPSIILEEKEVKKTFKLGKSGKKISILIKNNKSRKKVEDAKTEHKKTHVSTIKNYLKKHNLIKFGSTAPTKLLREMYETSELCGGISNENKDVLIHNFNK